MRSTFWMQVGGLVLLAGALAYAVIRSQDDWGDWIVLGVIVLTVVGAIIAIHHREYPTRKRAFTRDSKSDW